MPRNMSFALTTEQIKNKTKTVTRRFAWWKLKPGDVLQPVEKSMGLKSGEKIKRIGWQIRVVSVRREPLHLIDKIDCIKEGFPGFEPIDFICMLQDHYMCKPDKEVNRIEFEYI